VRLLELSLRNYRVFEELDLELPGDRVIGIFGVNGGGKSSLMESVLWACFGRARTDKKLIRTAGVLTDCAVRVAFEHGGQQYVVRRTIKGKGHQVEAELLVGDLLLASGVQEVATEMRRLLHMDQQVFRASVFAEQKQLDAFSDVTPGKRKDMVMRLLGIKPVEQALARARREAKDTKGDADRMAGSLPDADAAKAALAEATEEASATAARAQAAASALEEARRRAEAAGEAFAASERVRERVDQIEIERRGTEGQLEEVDSRREHLEIRIETFGEALASAPALQDERRELAGAPERLDAGRRFLEAAHEVARVRTELEALPEVDAAGALATMEEAQAERDRTAGDLARAEAARDRSGEELEAAQDALARAGQADPSEPCPTCGRPLGHDFKEYVAHCRKQVDAAKRRAAQATSAFKEAAATSKRFERRFKDAIRAGYEARKAADRRFALEERLEGVGRRAADLGAPFEGKEPDLEELQRRAARATEVDQLLAGLDAERKHLTQAEEDLARAREEHDRLAERLRRLGEELGALGFDPEGHARARKERDEAGRLLDEARVEERTASDAHQAARARVRELEAEIRKVQELAAKVRDLREEARVVERVGLLLDGFRDHLVARIGPELSREAEVLFRELTNHEYDDLRIDEETLAIHIADGTEYYSIERFSGSESDLANLALRAAISLHLSRMSGADVGLMVLDEVLGALDAERKDLFVQTMGRLAGHFHQLFVITHAEQVKDQFPASIEVRKVGRRRSEAILV
jgi:exonuclease SbcC